MRNNKVVNITLERRQERSAPLPSEKQGGMVSAVLLMGSNSVFQQSDTDRSLEAAVTRMHHNATLVDGTNYPSLKVEGGGDIEALIQ